ncbi:MAG: hypothetical protein PVI03_07165 [Candidatus Thorarchaeota archaeon]
MNIMNYLNQRVEYNGLMVVVAPKVQATHTELSLQQITNQQALVSAAIDHLQEALADIESALSKFEVIDSE